MGNIYGLPLKPHSYQEEGAIEIVKNDCTLVKYKVGKGKTLVSVLAALHYAMTKGVSQIWVLVPPILADQWYEFLSQVSDIPSVLNYRGTPLERADMTMDESVIIVSYNIFRGKRDFKRFIALAKQETLCIIADELSLKSLKSQTYRKLKQIIYRKMRVGAGDEPYHKLIALNATPISDLSQVYNWCALLSPGLYGSKRLFDAAHVEKEDNWGNVLEWKNENLLLENMEYISVDTDVEVELPPLVETVIPYRLSKQHMKLYLEVQAAELEALPEDKIELALRSMFSTLQRLVMVPSEFGLDIRPPILDFLEGYLDQCKDEGVLLYTRHVSVSELISQALGVPAIFGKVKGEERTRIIAGLNDGSETKVLGNMDSISHGLNFQMLNHLVFLELPFRADKLTQCIGRVHRQGQQTTCYANYPIAKGTIQESIYYKLLKNDKDLSPFLNTKRHIVDFLG